MRCIRSTYTTLFLATLTPIALLSCATPIPPTTGDVSDRAFHSAIVDDDYILRVRVPPGYDTDTTRIYPLVVQLDPTFVGLREFDTSAGLVSEHATQGDWPEAVVVGIDYRDPFVRERDYRPVTPPDPAYQGLGADRFYRVLRDEILPEIHRTLRVDPATRTLVGHSNGAVFAWYATFRHVDGEAPLFARVVAADCGYDEVLFTFERWHAERARTLPVRLYASRAVYNGAAQQVVFRAMISRVADRQFPDLQLSTEEIETDHGGAILPSFEDGLAFAFGASR